MHGNRLIRFVWEAGAAIVFVAPIILNLAISDAWGVDVALPWVVAMVTCSWIRLTISSKFIDLGNRFFGLSSNEFDKKISIYRSLLVERLFLLFQICVSVLAVYVIPSLGWLQALFMISLLVSNSIRDQLLFMVRLTRGAEDFYKIAWADGLCRLFLVLPIIFLGELAQSYIFVPILFPVVCYIPIILLVRGREQTDRSLLGVAKGRERIDGFRKFFCIQQLNSLVRFAYQNIDIPVLSYSLEGEQLWFYLTARQIIVQGTMLSVAPKIQVLIPSLVNKFEYHRDDFPEWLLRRSTNIFVYSVISVLFLSLISLSFYYIIVGGTFDGWNLIIFCASLALVRSNLWWNKDVVYFWNSYASTFISLFSSIFSVLNMICLWWFEGVLVFMIVHVFVFAFNAVCSLAIEHRLRTSKISKPGASPT